MVGGPSEFRFSIYSSIVTESSLKKITICIYSNAATVSLSPPLMDFTSFSGKPFGRT